MDQGAGVSDAQENVLIIIIALVQILSYDSFPVIGL